MTAKRFPAISLLLASALMAGACTKGGAPGAERVIKSTKSGDLTVTLASSTGEVKNGENELIVSFTDGSGNPVDVGAASLTFHMAAMGTMAEMNDRATLTTTDTPGKYHARVEIGMVSTWEAVVVYEGPRGSGQMRMTVNVK
ncbi:MAG: FixH family protein [Acidobacteriota bacterium]